MKVIINRKASDLFQFLQNFATSEKTGYIVLRALVKVICDHKSGKSKGYGFVKFESETAASKALKEMDGQVLVKVFLMHTLLPVSPGFIIMLLCSYWMAEA